MSKESQPSGGFLCLVFPGGLFLGSDIDFGALDVDGDGAGDIDVPLKASQIQSL